MVDIRDVFGFDVQKLVSVYRQSALEDLTR